MSFSIRWIVLVLPSLIASFVACQSAMSGTITSDVTFSTSDQSMWTPGTASANLKKSVFIGPEWESSTKAWWGSIPSVTGFAAVHLHEGRLGLEASIQASTGGVDVDYPMQLNFTYPDVVQRGETFQLQSSYVRKANPKLDITGFGSEIKVDAVANVHATWGGGYDSTDLFFPASYTADHGDTSSMSYYGDFLGTIPGPSPADDGIDVFDYKDDLTLFTTNNEQRVNLITIGSGTGVDFEIPGFDVAGISAQVPAPLNQSTMAYQSNGNLKTSATGDPFLSLDLDVVKIASLIAQSFSGGVIPPLSAEVEFESFSTSFAYSLLDVAISAGPALHQDFEFVFKGVDVTLTTNDGQTVTGAMGDSFNLVAPTDGSDLEIEALVSINQEFLNKTGVALQAALSLGVLSADAEFFGVKLVSIGPLYETSTSANSPPFLFLTPDAFALEGFNTEKLNLRISVVPEPSTLAITIILAAFAVPRLARRRIGRH